MHPELETLRITERELERLSGLEVNEIFIGGVLGGVVRLSALRQPRRLLLFGLTEGIATLLVFVFSLPIGLVVLRDAGTSINQWPVLRQFLQLTLGFTLLVLLGWHVYMGLAVKRLQPLMHLLDEVDRYNEVIQAIELLDRLEAVGDSQLQRLNRQEVLQALQFTRNSLTAGLNTEKLLRQHRKLIARRSDLLLAIETNLTDLKTLKINHQANEYSHLLNQALQIGISVQQEVQKLSLP